MMRRRQFFEVTASVLTGSALAGCGSRARRSVEQPDVARAYGPITATVFHATGRFADTPFGRIAYVERGTGPAALLLHGFPLNSFQWRGAIDRLSAQRRCVAPDFMALG